MAKLRLELDLKRLRDLDLDLGNGLSRFFDEVSNLELTGDFG